MLHFVSDLQHQLPLCHVLRTSFCRTFFCPFDSLRWYVQRSHACIFRHMCSLNQIFHAFNSKVLNQDQIGGHIRSHPSGFGRTSTASISVLTSLPLVGLTLWRKTKFTNRAYVGVHTHACGQCMQVAGKPCAVTSGKDYGNIWIKLCLIWRRCFGDEQVAMRRFSALPYSECVEVRILEKSAGIDRDSPLGYMSISSASSISDHHHMGAIMVLICWSLQYPRAGPTVKKYSFQALMPLRGQLGCVWFENQ
jgi:hypothetical protein